MDMTGGDVEAYSRREKTEDGTSIQETEANLNLIVSNGDILTYQSQTEANSGLAILDIDVIRKKIEGLFSNMPRLGYDASLPAGASRSEDIEEHTPNSPPILSNRVRKTIGSIETGIKTERSVKMRRAKPEDIEELVEVDMVAFRSVYKHYDLSPEALRSDLLEKFRQRFEKVGSDWITVLKKDDEMVGFLMACPTDKPPEDFISWESNTDGGTLDTTYASDGKYIFIVSLSVLGQAANLGGQNMLALDFIGKLTAKDYLAYFESRVPGLKRWALHRCHEDGMKFSDITAEQERQYADEYFENNVVKGEFSDPLLKLYHDMGCKFVKLVPNAYRDELSLNYGVVATIESPLPDYLQKIPIARRLTGKALSVAAHSRWLAQKVG